MNLSIIKDTLIGLQFRLEIFNLFNRVNLGTVQRTVYSARADVEAPIGSAGRITATSIPARQVQLGVRDTF